MNTFLAVILVVGSVLLASATVAWIIRVRITRVENFLEHLEGRIILLQEAEFSRRLIAQEEHWREQFGEAPPKSLAADARMTFDILPRFKQCEAEYSALLRTMSNSRSA